MMTSRSFVSILASTCFVMTGCTLSMEDAPYGAGADVGVDQGSGIEGEDGSGSGSGSGGGDSDDTGKGIITGNGAAPLTPELITLYSKVAEIDTRAALTPSLLELSDLIATADGRTFLSYLVKCALPAGKTLTLKHGGDTITLPGVVGLTPEWEKGGLSPSAKRWLSACLLAHVNATASKVQILLAGNHPALAGSKGGTANFSLREGAFFGNIFELTPAMYACTGSGQKAECGRESSEDLAKRACARGLLGPGLSACGFIVPGFCHDPVLPDACEGLEGSAYHSCHGSLIDALPVLESPLYEEVITVYLQSEGYPPSDAACE